MIIDASDQVADLRALNAPPFNIDFWCTMCTFPAIEGGTNISNTSAPYADIIREVNSIMAFYASKFQLASILLPAKRSCQVDFNASTAASAISDASFTVIIGSSIEPRIFYDIDSFSPFDLPHSA
jgi:hypothetical protein